jgi:hypothetical protein
MRTVCVVRLLGKAGFLYHQWLKLNLCRNLQFRQADERLCGNLLIITVGMELLFASV